MKFNFSILKKVMNISSYLDQENKKLLRTPLQIIAGIVLIAGSFALIFEIYYFAQFSFELYFGRLIATVVGFTVFVLTFFNVAQKRPALFVHILLLTIIGSFASVIYQIPKTLFVNSQLLALVIFTSALFLNWDLKNQIILAIYYNLIFAASILLSDHSIFFLPNIYALVIFVMIISIMSLLATSINYRLRHRVLEKTFEANEIIDNSAEGIFKANLAGEISLVNPAFVEMMEFNSVEKLLIIFHFLVFSNQKRTLKNSRR